jgi:antitoxin component of MazEF toxin-antitoxin module
METTREKATYENHNRRMGWDGAIRIPDEALQELEMDVGDSVYLIEEFVGNTRCLVLSKKPQITDRIDELTEAWNSEQRGSLEDK